MKNKAFIQLILSMFIFGTIGIFVKSIQLPRGLIACVRGLGGSVLLLLILLLTKKKPSLEAIRKNLPILIVSGAAIGINWILLFESYSYTTVAASTLCYYMAPVFVLIASRLIFKEALGKKKLICAAISVIGAVLVSGIFENGSKGGLFGCLLALGAAVFYASVVLMNKKLSNISPFDSTLIQLASAGSVILPYTLISEAHSPFALAPQTIILLTIVALLHTGIAYTLYFTSIRHLKTDTVAIFSYLDPVVAVILSLIMGEFMSPTMAIGAALILGALIFSETPSTFLKKGGAKNFHRR